MPERGYSVTGLDPDRTVRCAGRELRISPKASVELCRTIRGMKLPEAKKLLERVIEKKGRGRISPLSQRGSASSKSYRTLLRRKISPKSSREAPSALRRARGKRGIPEPRYGEAEDNTRGGPESQQDSETKSPSIRTLRPSPRDNHPYRTRRLRGRMIVSNQIFHQGCLSTSRDRRVTPERFETSGLQPSRTHKKPGRN